MQKKVKVKITLYSGTIVEATAAHMRSASQRVFAATIRRRASSHHTYYTRLFFRQHESYALRRRGSPEHLESEIESHARRGECVPQRPEDCNGRYQGGHGIRAETFSFISVINFRPFLTHTRTNWATRACSAGHHHCLRVVPTLAASSRPRSPRVHPTLQWMVALRQPTHLDRASRVR
eukprot:COSAG02_NODE_36_length_48934_cov_144.851029_18_plen_178_part_00